MTAEQFDGIAELTVDYERDEVRVATVDGRITVQAGVAQREKGLLNFKRVTFKPADLVLELTVPWGELLEVEVFDRQEGAREAGRPVVYLDQNKWVQIAKAANAPEKVDAQELGPTLDLIELARDKAVLLPLSSGHWIETGPLDRHQRQHVAALMVALSRGWIMRDPLRVTESELARLLAGEDQIAETFSLDSRELYAEPMGRYVPKEDGLPEGFVDLINALTGVQSIMAVLLEDERTKDAAGVLAAQRWAAVHAGFSKQLNAGRYSRETKRWMTLGSFIQDLGHGLTDAAKQAGWTAGDLESWVEERADEEFALVPYLHLRREVTHARLLNIDDRWHENDLVDMLYLPCAAAYADYVVCEKKTAHYLRRAGRNRSEGAAMYTSIAKLVPVLQSFGSGST